MHNIDDVICWWGATAKLFNPVWAQIAKFKNRQYFQLYGISDNLLFKGGTCLLDKIYFTITVSTFLYTRFHSIYNLLLARDGLFFDTCRYPICTMPQVTHGKCVTTFHSVSNKLSVFTTTVCAYSVLRFSFLCE